MSAAARMEEEVEMEAEALVSALCLKHKHTAQAVLEHSAPEGYKGHVLAHLPTELGKCIARTSEPDTSRHKTSAGVEHRVSLYAMNRGELVAFVKQVIQCQQRPVLLDQLIRSQGGRGPKRTQQCPHGASRTPGLP